MTDLVMLSLEGWDQVWRRNQHLIAGLLRADPSLRVLFVEPASDPLHALSSGRRPAFGHSARVSGDTSRLWTAKPVKWLPRRVDRSADDRLARWVMRTAAAIGFEHPLLWINDPSAAPIAMLSGWPTLYDMTDDWLSADRPPAERERIAASETYLLGHAHEVVACSSELQRRKQDARPSTAHAITLIPNAVDAAAYRTPHPRPADLPDGPVALYVGTLHSDRLDVQLSERTASALAGGGTLVFVGPDLLAADVSNRLTRAGVVLLGARAHAAVIGYLQHADVLVVPHAVTQFTDSLDPIKLYEYQAVGRPVVSTPVAGFRDADDPRVTIADGDAFIEAVVSAIRGPRAHVGDEPGPVVPDWSERVAAAHDVLDRMRR